MIVKESLSQPDEWNEKHELKWEREVVAEDDRRQIEPESQSNNRARTVVTPMTGKQLMQIPRASERANLLGVTP